MKFLAIHYDGIYERYDVRQYYLFGIVWKKLGSFESMASAGSFIRSMEVFNE